MRACSSPNGEAGVAIEIEGWEINNDLIKFWRGHTRGQIAVGVLVQPDPGTVRYCFDQMRLLTEPLFGSIPIAFLAPDGPGLKQSASGTKQPKYPDFDAELVAARLRSMRTTSRSFGADVD